jgi:glutamate racemase
MRSFNNNYSIGVFDSGLGGLTVVKELKRKLPNESIVYFGDTARVPYGTKSKESVIRFSCENVRVLLKHNVKMIVVACNTSSSLALTTLKKTFRMPIIGVIEPGAKKAAVTTQSRVIGVVATPATILSGAYKNKIKIFLKSAKVISQACPLFVPLAEEGWFANPVTEFVAGKYLKTIKNSKADTLILGCTHYPLLKNTIAKVVGKKVRLIDSANEVAIEVKRLLDHNDLRRQAKSRPKYEFLVSDAPQHFQKLARQFLGYPIKRVKRVNDV